MPVFLPPGTSRHPPPVSERLTWAKELGCAILLGEWGHLPWLLVAGAGRKGEYFHLPEAPFYPQLNGINCPLLDSESEKEWDCTNSQQYHRGTHSGWVNDPTEGYRSATWWTWAGSLTSPSQSQQFVCHLLLEQMETHRDDHMFSPWRQSILLPQVHLESCLKNCLLWERLLLIHHFFLVCASYWQPWKTIAWFCLKDLISKTFSSQRTTQPSGSDWKWSHSCRQSSFSLGHMLAAKSRLR